MALGSERVTPQDIYAHYSAFLRANPQGAPAGGLLDMDVKLGTGSGGPLQVRGRPRRAGGAARRGAAAGRGGQL